MDEKRAMSRRDVIVPPEPEPDSDTDSDFDNREADVIPRTFTATGTSHASDLPPTYEEAVRHPTVQETTHAPAPDYDANITVYRTEIPPNPPIIVSDEKMPAVLPDPEPQAKRLLDEALKFTETPPPQAERQALRVPIAIPSFAGAATPVRFARFYASALYPQSVADVEFVEFIDGLNNLAVASHFSAAALGQYHAQHGMDARPEVTRGEEHVGTTQLVPAYLALSNSHFFNPRGLHVQVVTLLQLAEHANIGNEAIRKTILQEVLRMSRTSIDVPAAANGAASQAAAALVPYFEALTTAVPEPRKKQEALHDVAAHFASLEMNNNGDGHADAVALQEGIRRSNTSNSQSSSSKNGKSWNEWGNDIGNFWEDFGQRQGQFWGRWGEDQGKKWGQWGEDFGKKVASGPPSWVTGPSGRGHRAPGACGPLGVHGGGRPGMHNRFSSHGWTGRPEGWGGRHGSMPWTPQIAHSHTTPAALPMPYGVVPGVHMPLQPPGGRLPPTPPSQLHIVPPISVSVSMPGAFPIHQPPLHEYYGPHGSRDHGANDDDNEDENFEDVADRLSLSSVSSLSEDSDSDSEHASTLVDDDISDPDAIFAQKAAYIESMAASARAQHQKPAEEIEFERTKAMMDLEKQHQKVLSKREYRAQKSEIRKVVRAWKRSVKAELKDLRGMDKQEKRAWKQTRKADWRGFQQRLKQHDRAYRQQRQQRRRDSKQLASQAKREGKMKAWEGKRQEWEDKRKDWEGRRATRSGGCGAVAKSGGSGSVETPHDDVYTQAKQMLWILVTKHEG